jgi:hypothetical protein
LPDPDDPQYCVPPVLGVPGVQVGPAASPVEPSSPTVASAEERPPSLLDPELAVDVEVPELPADRLPELLVEVL